MVEYSARGAYAGPTASPFHQPPTGVLQASPRQHEVRNDMTQQINSAVIGSSEAEFQNDFIQVSHSTSFSPPSSRPLTLDPWPPKPISTTNPLHRNHLQVFPMYQIAPQPEKNTTPYLT